MVVVDGSLFACLVAFLRKEEEGESECCTKGWQRRLFKYTEVKGFEQCSFCDKSLEDVHFPEGLF